MKRLILLLAVLGWASAASAAVAHVHSDGGSCTGGHTGNMPAACAATNTTTFTYTSTNAGDATVFALGCASTTGTPSAVTLTSPGWTTTQVGSIVGSTVLGWIATYKAYALNTSAATFTVTWTVTSSTCSGFMNDLVDEFSGADGSNFVDNNNAGSGTTGCALSITPVANNTGVWFACNDSVTAVTAPYTIGGDDAAQDVAEWKILAGGAGASQASAWTSSGNFTIVAVTIKPPGAAGPPQRTVIGVGTE